MLVRFGGHAYAAGLTLAEADLPRFAAAFEAVAREQLSPSQLRRTLESDGTLGPGELDLDLAEVLRQEVWGQGFPAPVFDDTFAVAEQRIVGARHSRLALVGRAPRPPRSAIRRSCSTMSTLAGHAPRRLPARRQRVERDERAATGDRALAARLSAAPGRWGPAGPGAARAAPPTRHAQVQHGWAPLVARRPVVLDCGRYILCNVLIDINILPAP